jgi:serine/threonine-protein kinase
VQDPVVEMSVAPNKEDDPPAVSAPDTGGHDISQINTDEINDENPAATKTVAGTETDGKKPGLKRLGEGELLNGRYKISRKIGGGGMGAVYLAQDNNLGGVERAVKEMIQSSIEEDQQRKAIEDFRRESMILSTLDHPSIPTIYDYFFDESQGRFYLVMKYISGGDLAGRLRAASGGKIDERTVTDWAIQVCEVLAYLHGLPSTIVYRDLKPSNIMLDGNTGRVMLIDFGIARAINAEEKGVTAVGTMGYAPPELFSGQVEPRSDIYSLGSTMFHLLTGADPQNNPLLIFDFQKNPRPRQINPQLSDQMEKILMRAVEYNADHRFSSAEEMRRVLVEHLENLKRGAVTYGVTETPAAVSLSNQSVFCGFCGQRIIATDLFCAFCGSKQPIAQQGVHAEIYRPAASGQVARTAKLVIEGTSELDAPIFALEKTDNLVGRRDPMANIFPEIDLSRYDPQTKISRRHARIWRDGDAFLVEDLGSSNGTILLAAQNETVRLQPHHPYMLGNGDRLRLGDTTLHFMKG